MLPLKNTLPNAAEKDSPPVVKSPENLEFKVSTIEKTLETKLPEETEQTGEQVEIKEDGKFLEDTIEGLKNTLRGTKRKPSQIPQVRDEITIKVEKIMEEGIADAFKALNPIQQQEFKIEGEKTAMEIRSVLRNSHVKIKKIFQLLINWLKLLPGINRFFLEQEAKIKADKIIALKKIEDKL
ncbi:MAG: hypothetical protein A2469_03990 [Candidatus Magasanikbacteria bacterium RIFOXYC2_FULL_40_16]|uniref:Uncharacterized protein n=1 Tax=Candidatus Magasanikbacteria bacterium RIFOXYC2_FULL_40_16 TaxID=1798703 RepID=A0A1F6P1W2_9BACT|nr:MAG: hypothetical protein A2224_00620 [Candidatus Magasanikbacteria bacterium RIFOXYA2_FULL_40_20]OGH86846.1 MAG: hypothetical protein A2301_03960 [Candidatus Magasanikbacteria bacterium RIFOXYB2_FULL_40_13]OGH90156.1 MAG: hypothetical protein A2469_03990 [Candidatus Magasanikbacteria bacterium RIFOXYC2_FULL_40_16]